MIVTTLSLVLFSLFSILGGIHFYWLFGGIWGLRKAIPTKSKSANTLAIPKFATLIVALGLVSFGLMYLVQSGLVKFSIPSYVLKYGYWFIAIIFILRAIGEFNYVGFFKKIKDTEFAEADSKLFSPLCLGIGLMGLIIELLK